MDPDKRSACRHRSLDARKTRLEKLLAKAPTGIQFSQHIEGDGAAIFAHACKLGLEGIVSKNREHPYRSGPSKAWLEIKNVGARRDAVQGSDIKACPDHLTRRPWKNPLLVVFCFMLAVSPCSALFWGSGFLAAL
jgi:hypothetical protein